MTDRNTRYWLPLLILALVARGIVVDGYMPSEDGLKVCPSGGLHAMAASEGDGDHGHGDEPECPWQSVFFSVVPVHLPDTLAMLAPSHRSPVLADAVHAGLGLTGLPPTRAPPLYFS